MTPYLRRLMIILTPPKSWRPSRSLRKRTIGENLQPCRNFIGKIDTISLECLYAIDDTYTLQAVWSISGTEKSSGKTMNKTFVAIVTVRKTGDVFKIVGFNRPFREYSLLSDKLGSVFFK